MNQFKIARLIIPYFKGAYNERQAQEKFKGYIIKALPQTKPGLHSTLNSQLSLLNPPHCIPVEPRINNLRDNTSEQEECQDSTQQTSLFDAREQLLRKNMIDNRVKSLQYQANNPCEDTIVYEQLKFLDAYTVSIFDGHGGPELAEYSKCKINTFIDNYLKQHLPQLNSKQPINISQILKDSISWSYKQLQESFFQIYKEHMRIGNKKIRSVGACGITAIIHNDKVYIGNAGDSQAIFILSNGGTLMKTQKANERLSVNNKAERERIKQKWKDIDENIITQQGNNCYYLKGRLQPTRTIGDYYLKKEECFYGDQPFKGPYLDCDPEISVHQLTSAHKYMVMASDGVWDVLSRNEVMSSLMREKQIDLNKTCYEQEKEEQGPYVSNTLECALNKYSQITGKPVQQVKAMQRGHRRNYHDDITIAVINLEFQL